MAVSPEVALAAPGQLYHQGTQLPAAFHVTLEGQVVQTPLLHALKEENEPSLCLPPLELGLWGSSLLPAGDLVMSKWKTGLTGLHKEFFSWSLR